MDRDAIRKLANSANREERRKADRIFRISSVLKAGAEFTTGNGKINQVIMTATNKVYLKARNGQETISISVGKIKKMLAYFLRVRVVERKELEIFHAHSSALFGLLAAIYGKKSKINRLGRGCLRLIMNGIRLFFAGFERSPGDLREAVRHGAKHVLASYFYTRSSSRWRFYLEKFKLRCILDSGAFSAWMAQRNGRKVDPLDIDQYIEFIRANDDVIDHYFAFDYIGDWRRTMQALRYMEQKQMAPIPIFHLGTPMEVLAELVADGYPVIALGGTVNQKKSDIEAFFNKVFTLYPDQAFHGLGVSRAEWLQRYPFFTCDSKAWITVRWKELILSKYSQLRAPQIEVEQRWNQSVKFWTSLERPGVYSRYATNSELRLAS